MNLINIHLLTAGRLLAWHSAVPNINISAVYTEGYVCLFVCVSGSNLSVLLFLQLTGVIKTRMPVMTHAEVRLERKEPPKF